MSYAPESLPSKLLFVRHAQTHANVNRVWHGHTDTELTETGHLQAAQLGQYFHQYMQPDIIIASPLLRTRLTAQAIADANNLPVSLDPRLMEFHLGDWENTSFDDLQGKMAVAARLRDEPDFTPPNGESQNIVRQRMVEAVEEIIREHSGAKVAIVSHGVAIAVTLAHYLVNDTTQWLKYNMNNTGIAELCLATRSLPSFNLTSHLLETEAE